MKVGDRSVLSGNRVVRVSSVVFHSGDVTGDKGDLTGILAKGQAPGPKFRDHSGHSPTTITTKEPGTKLRRAFLAALSALAGGVATDAALR